MEHSKKIEKYMDCSFNDLIGIIFMLEENEKFLIRWIVSNYNSGCGIGKEKKNVILYSKFLANIISIEEYLSNFSFKELLRIFESQCCELYK